VKPTVTFVKRTSWPPLSLWVAMRSLVLLFTLPCVLAERVKIDLSMQDDALTTEVSQENASTEVLEHLGWHDLTCKNYQDYLTLPFTCNGATYLRAMCKHTTKPGQFGIVVGLHKAKTGRTPDVAAKLMPTNQMDTNTRDRALKDAEKECAVMQHLESQGVTHCMKCLGVCEVQGLHVLIMTPYVVTSSPSKVQQPSDPSRPIRTPFFKDEERELLAVRNTVNTMIDFVRAGVANTDQGHNVFYFKDGNILLFDFGAAEMLKSSQDFNFWKRVPAQQFMYQVLANIPKKYFEGDCVVADMIIEASKKKSFVVTDNPDVDFAQTVCSAVSHGDSLNDGAWEACSRKLAQNITKCAQQ